MHACATSVRLPSSKANCTFTPLRIKFLFPFVKNNYILKLTPYLHYIIVLHKWMQKPPKRNLIHWLRVPCRSALNRQFLNPVPQSRPSIETRATDSTGHSKPAPFGLTRRLQGRTFSHPLNFLFIFIFYTLYLLCCRFTLYSINWITSPCLVLWKVGCRFFVAVLALERGWESRNPLACHWLKAIWKQKAHLHNKLSGRLTVQL